MLNSSPLVPSQFAGFVSGKEREERVGDWEVGHRSEVWWRRVTCRGGRQNQPVALFLAYEFSPVVIVPIL